MNLGTPRSQPWELPEHAGSGGMLGLQTESCDVVRSSLMGHTVISP